ncbi:terminase gpA endonuclease subunit [Iodidimonas nitroreducens]|nr:terminase gpA endonuclease subunit [Iodidimonas nitroreducens]
MPKWAERYRKLKNPKGGYSGPWRHDIAPHLIEPMNALSDPSVSLVGLQGPAQSGKSDIGLNWWGATIHQQPTDFMICQPDKAMMQDFVVRRLEPLIDQHRVLKEKMLPGGSSDNIFLKRFRGMLSTHIWPVGAQFRARPVPWGWLDDYDDFPEDIDGQGSALSLLEGRQTTFEGAEKTYVSSSPSRDGGGGIEAICEAGSNERFYWRCPQCNEYFSPEFDKHLRFDTKGSADDAERTAHLTCPHNGCIIDPVHKRQMLLSALDLPHNGWLQPHQKPFDDSRVEGDWISVRWRTFRVDGLMGFTSWPKLARAWRLAQITLEMRQDESELRAFWNVKGGKNYRSMLTAEKPVDINVLMARRESWQMQTVPAGVRVLTAAVDIQANRFEVMVVGWGDGLECWPIDRFDIHLLEDRSTLVEPARYPEHWLTLINQVVMRRYPSAVDPSQSVPILTTAIDTGGEDGVKDNAVKFWHAARLAGVHAHRITLVKGGSNPKGKLLPAPSFLDVKSRGGPEKAGPRLWVPNVNAMKSIVDARLRREKPGPGYIHWPANWREEWFDELTAEELRRGKWIKIRSRNETLDLMVYNYTALMRAPFAGTRANMGWVPAAFRAPIEVTDNPPNASAAALKLEDYQSMPAKANGEREQVNPEPSATGESVVRESRHTQAGSGGWIGTTGQWL